MRIRATIAIGVMALAAAGCGGSGDRQQVRSAFEKTIHEVGSHNLAACSGFTARYLLEQTGQSSYSDALATCRRQTTSGSVSVPARVHVGKIKVKGDSATLKAVVPGRGSGLFHFLKQNGQWKIDSVTAK
jgi:hypothetical protein